MLTANHKQVLYVKIIKSKDLLRRVNLKKAWTQQMYVKPGMVAFT